MSLFNLYPNSFNYLDLTHFTLFHNFFVMGGRESLMVQRYDHNNIAGDGWERELDSAEKLHQNALSLIGDRGKYNRLFISI